mgnify:CR=1 FL=1
MKEPYDKKLTRIAAMVPAGKSISVLFYNNWWSLEGQERYRVMFNFKDPKLSRIRKVQT